MRIAFLVGERVMFAMHRDPLSGVQAGSEPQYELERKDQRGMELERFVRRGSMQVNRRGEHRHLSDEYRDQERDDE